MVLSQIDASHLGTYLFILVRYIFCTIYLNIIEIYVYLNKLGSIACYLAQKQIPLICINLLVLHFLYFLLFEKIIP